MCDSPLTGRPRRVHNPHKPAGAGLRRRPGRFISRAQRDARRGVRRCAVALARLLANEGRDVTLAGAGPASAAALELRSLGVEVRENADLDADPGEHDEAFLDVWTPEVAPRV